MTQEVRRKKVFSIGNYLFTGITLGKGNFARVEEAVHTILNVRVAIKIMDVNHIKEDYVIKNLYREAKIMAKLNHPCIVTLFQTMQRSDNVYYLVTELANGGDLCAFVKKQSNGKLDEKLTKIYARQFASALSHMHNLGVVHRDLKMENVMLNSVQTQIKIVDFGLSNIWTSESPLKTHCGSPEYAAPELFVTGKQYGAEVDLWSLGIILYGMVLGQLPFVTSRCQQLPSQERRKQLVAQINKGLSTAHRRALSPFTPDFRSLMSRLLVADSSKRITIKELMVHPWITDKGKRMIRTNPLKNLDSYERNKLYGKISAVLQMDPKQINTAILQEPLGKVGGVYNVLKRKFQLGQIQGDGASKTMPQLTIFELANLTKSLEKDQVKNTLSKKLYKPQSAQTQTKTTEFYTPRVPSSSTEGKVSRHNSAVATNEPTKNTSRIRKKYPTPTKQRPVSVQETSIIKNIQGSGEGKVRPITVQPVVEEKADYRCIKSPSLRRKVYSATLNKQVSVPVSPGGKLTDSIPSTPTGPDSNEKEKEQKLLPIEKLSHKITISLAKSKESTRNKEKERTTSPLIKQIKPPHQKFDKIIGRKPSKQILPITKDINADIRTKSEQVSRRRSLAAPLQQILEKSLKTAGVIVKGSASKTPTKSLPKDNKKEPNIKEDHSNKDRPNMAYGDYVSRASTAPNPARKLAIYDPIAKSIADYVSNNVSDKIYHYPWLKK